MKNTILTFWIVFCVLMLSAQNTTNINSKLLQEIWSAKWVSHPDITGDETGVYLFKKVLSFKTIPEDYVINISADNRYVLYINGKVVTRGPARCDLNRWLFDTVDIAPYLKVGENHIAAKVWNMAQLKPVAQMSLKTGLIIQGNTEQEQEINTNTTWRVVIDEAYSFYKIMDLRRFYASGPGEKFNADLHPWYWKISDNEISWKKVKEGNNGMPMNYYNITGKTDKRLLCPRSIPMMEKKKQDFAEVRRMEGVKNAKDLIAGSKPVKIPANKTAVILLDQGHLTNAYPQLKFSKGRNSTIKITYAESLFIPKDGKPTFDKGNRNDVEGKVMWGNYDIIEVDGGDDRFFEPLWWRSFRYVELKITTGEEPLILEGFSSEFTGYPFKLKSSFESEDSRMSAIFDVAWRTQRLCAGEIFFDCPYYEQLQYTGDTRIQGLNTAYASGDTRLWKDAIQDYYDSRLPFGLTQSRYPSSTQQIIAPFSLVWITMVNDYMMHCEDVQFIEKMVPAILDILNWYDARVADNGMLGKLESWLFVDWVDAWKTGYPPLTKEKKYSAVIGMQYVYTIHKAMEIFDAYGMTGLKNKWALKAKVTQNSILKHCWDEDKQLLADTPEKNTFSQHANVLAILSNTFEVAQEKELMQRVFNNKEIAQTSFYFDFYKIAALKKVGLGNMYISTLDTLSGLLDKGLTTFPEKADPTRSDCHAWSASPLYYYLALVCGIEPAAPGFNSVRIEPHLGDLNWVKGSMPHKLGEIKVNLKKTKSKKIIGTIFLPEGLTGTYIQNGKQIILKSGENQMNE
ncbi:family 78 glycoside hydrolase catalytic domain [Tamlana fucoidanivorans]|uniref:Alpha-L-rhamnosidase n=1 Tax=Allotamlana fucoidanivorans TaxID=2583814 RepID=A0A5C4SMI4_9FLAO|nr:alpha-L-rhamnosidase C-terminal domain-containing protein [Tamlana fucoidanivorans]TNJ44958.1 alpha-L-rhamnosidase [Tamlana fucoidanivorans]